MIEETTLYKLSKEKCHNMPFCKALNITIFPLPEAVGRRSTVGNYPPTYKMYTCNGWCMVLFGYIYVHICTCSVCLKMLLLKSSLFLKKIH